MWFVVGFVLAHYSYRLLLFACLFVFNAACCVCLFVVGGVMYVYLYRVVVAVCLFVLIV